jgi:hypothetical protein
MLVERAGSFRVAGVIQGGTGVICGSATQVVGIDTDRAWVVSRIRADTEQSRG